MATFAQSAVAQETSDGKTDWFTKRNLAAKDKTTFKDLKAQAENGNAQAQFVLGTLYSTTLKYGDMVTPNQKTACIWYLRAADQGMSTAQYNLGQCYKEGNAPVADPKKAIFWFEKAAAQNDVNAMKATSSAYIAGLVVAQDPEKARFW